MEEVEQFDNISIEELAEGMHNQPSRGVNLNFTLQNFPKILLDTFCSLTSSSIKMEGYHFL